MDWRLPAFVTLEGPEGAGKSSVIAALAGRLDAEGVPVVTTREPGSGEFGAQVRRLLLEGGDIAPAAELFLFLADRAEHVAKVVRPALAAGNLVLCDRYADSTVVYQGHARGMDLDFLRRANDVATGGLVPDVTLLLDLDPQIGLARIGTGDRLDREPIEFHRRVRAGFIAEADDRWEVVDASRPLGQVADACWAALRSRLA